MIVFSAGVLDHAGSCRMVKVFDGHILKKKEIIIVLTKQEELNKIELETDVIYSIVWMNLILLLYMRA